MRREQTISIHWLRLNLKSNVQLLNQQKTGCLAFFARVNYDYMRRYLFSVSLRYDGASQFTEGNRFTFFPAVSAGWNMHYENWFPKDIVSRLKLRASWGKLGTTT